MAIEISGKVIVSLDEVKGTSPKGEWRKREYVIETDGQYPKKVCFSVWGDKIDQFKIQANEVLTISFEPESREYNGRWFTELRAWRVQRGNTTGSSIEASSAAGNTTFAAPSNGAPSGNIELSEGEDDLPF